MLGPSRVPVFILAFILSREHWKILAGDPGKNEGGTAENKDYAVLMGVCGGKRP